MSKAGKLNSLIMFVCVIKNKTFALLCIVCKSTYLQNILCLAVGRRLQSPASLALRADQHYHSSEVFFCDATIVFKVSKQRKVFILFH